MYFFPSYTAYYEENDVLYVFSKLFQNKIKITDPTLQQEFHSLIYSGGCSQPTTPLTVFLHEQELLANEIEVECTIAKVKQLLSDYLMLTIMPTEKCNFRCPYCYESHDSIRMSRELLKQIQAYIVSQAPHFKFIVIRWFGGEPTICKDIILETSKLVQSLQGKYHFQYSSNMTTNGYLLDMDSFLEYYKAGITNYQVTLDGWNHDKTRPHVSGKGTLEIILNNLISISSLPHEKYPFHVVIRHNILDGDEDFSWYDYLYKLFGTDTRFSLEIASVTDWGGETVKSLKLAEGNKKKLLKTTHEKYIDEIGMQREGKNKDLFSDICYSSFPYGFIFRADGKIEKCTIALNHPKNLVGRVDPDKGVILDDTATQLWCSSSLKEKCYTCPDILSCLNICCRKKVIMDDYPEDVCLCAKTTIS